MILNLGSATRMIRTMAMIKRGMTTQKTMARRQFITNAMISPPISIPGALSSIRSPMEITFCILVISLVSLVTREPVENFSILANENSCTFLNTSLRRSAAKFTDAFTAK